MPARILTSLATALFLVGAAGVTRADTAATTHTTGLVLINSCPAAPVASSSTFHCSFVLANLDPDHGVANLLVTKQALSPTSQGKSLGKSLGCLQNGVPVTALGKAGSATASCSNSAVAEKAPACSSKGSEFFMDRIEVSGVDAAFPALPVSQSASSTVTVRACAAPSMKSATNERPALTNAPTSASAQACGFLLIDEDSIDNDNPPNYFSAQAVNDKIAAVGLRAKLPIFTALGATIDLWTGTVGDEGWFAPKAIPESWASAGPIGEGLGNFSVVPLRAEGLEMLEGSCACAVVYDDDIHIEGSSNADLKGANLGIAAFAVLDVKPMFGQPPGSLPGVTIRILDADQVCGAALRPFTELPMPASFDIDP
jgi:hypothetical protein